MMRPTSRSIRLTLPIAAGIACVALPASHPSLAPASGVDLTSTQPADPTPPKALANGTIRYTEPDGWDESTAVATDVRAVYVLHDHASVLSVEILPTDAKIGPESLGPLVRSLRQTRQQRKEKLVEGPTAEKDDRFLLRITEKFHSIVKVDDKPTDMIASQLHLYRQVGPRVMMITVWTTADDDEWKQAVSAGEDLAVSAKFGRPSKK